VTDWRGVERTALRDFAVVLSQFPDLDRWTAFEKQQLAQIIRAKAGKEEARYLELMQRHSRLREQMIQLGS
jgi:hypothetical protein